jgi:signal transduction histidine kinase
MFRLQSLGLADESGKIDEAVKILQKTMRRTQDLTFDLSPPILYELGLAKALQALIIRFDTHEDADFTILVEEEPRDISHSVGILLYRIARELLLNVVKHADATFVELRLSQNRDRITLSVTDDGRGMDVGIENSIGKQARGGFGLFSIRQRLEPLGGKLHLETHSGTTVKVTIPRFQEESGTTLEATS